ncbi:MAG: 16S rRNA (uracil(1498)-N(3))-methyltransferase [Pseudomonadota bacterium]
MSRTPRVYFDGPLNKGRRILLPADTSLYIIRVLRLGSGEPLVVFNGSGFDYAARLGKARKEGAEVEILAKGDEEAAAPLTIRLALGVSRSQKMDLALQKAVELGVSEIAPLFTERTVVKLSEERLEQRLTHWRHVVISACEQSGRRRVPPVNNARPYTEWLAEWRGYGVLLDPEAGDSLPELATPRQGVTLLVGPEGGFTAAEKTLAREAGMSPVRLGPRVMRTETAPLAAIAAMQVLWGDFR